MLQSIRVPTLAMPPFGHNTPIGGTQKMEGYGDTDTWSWQQSTNAQPSSYTPIFDPALYAHLGTHTQPQVPGSVARHHSIATSHVVNPGRVTPPQRHQIASAIVKAQPAFKPTWHGFLDTTKDAMTIVEAALQGRLGHISRRPHDKERAEMLTSGTVLVYEENASGIRRWTDAVHWSPSRVMNNCLIYRQLTRALKPEEKRSALNPSCGGKRKRKESVSPAITKSGENVNNSEDEYDNPVFDGAMTGDVSPTEPVGKAYANYAQSLTPDQQRRFCGSLIDSYEFKEGGLMKKTISVKYQGTNHHIISYYSLEDVVAGKLKRPFEDPKLADIQPRPALLTGWKVSLEDEESKDMPLVPTYAHHIQNYPPPPSDGYGRPVDPNQFPSPHQYNPQYAPQPRTSHYVPTPNQPPYQMPPQPYPTGLPNTTQHYTPSPQPAMSAPLGPIPRYASPPPSTQQYSPQTQPSPYTQLQLMPVSQPYNSPQTAQYPGPSQPSQYASTQAPVFDQTLQHPSSFQPPHFYRRTSAPVVMQSHTQPSYDGAPQTQQDTYYVPDTKFTPSQDYGY